MTLHSFHLTAKWPGLRNDVGTIETEHLHTKISIPPEMNGPGVGTNPDEMLLGAAATCYIITLAAMLERSGIQKDVLTMNSEGVVESNKGIITYQKIIHRPHLVILFEKDFDAAQKLAEKAENSCMISRALKGNVVIELEAKIEVK